MMEKSFKIVQFERIAKYAAVKYELNYMKDENASHLFFILKQRSFSDIPSSKVRHSFCMTQGNQELRT